MKRTPSILPIDVPPEIMRLSLGARIFDSSSSPEAKVYFIDRESGYYLKCAARGSLAVEASMTDYFHKRGLGAEVLSYISNERDFLLTSRIVGEDCTHQSYLSEPKRLARLLGEKLRALHEISGEGCPVPRRTEAYLLAAKSNYERGTYDKSAFPDSFGYRSAKEAYAVLTEGGGSLLCDTLIHGDYCLPNIMLDCWKFSGFIDVGCGGVGDRHIDLFWGSWTLWFNLGTNAYRDIFFDAYGRDKIDPFLLKTVAAAEVFG